MRKAFDANVPKLKPRLKLGGAPAAVEEEQAEKPSTSTSTTTTTSTSTSTAATANANGSRNRAVARVESQDQVQDQVQAQDQDPDPVRATPIVTGAAHSGNAGAPARTNGTSLSPTGGEGRGEGASRPHVDERSAAAEPAGDVLSRRERLEKIKRKVADAAKPQPRIHPVPADPARAAESVLGLVRDLELELVRAREREEALRGDLDDARRELGRTATEGRSAVERLAVTEKELEEKRTVLGELLGEMQALEEERDESVRRAQALAALDEERAKLLEELGRRADEEAKLRAEREAEVERLSDELRVAGTEGARLRAAVGELARERDQLGGDLDRIRRERDDLAEAKKALEAVHAALAQARARLG